MRVIIFYDCKIFCEIFSFSLVNYLSEGLKIVLHLVLLSAISNIIMVIYMVTFVPFESFLCINHSNFSTNMFS